jgi:hypothetical protein
MARHSLTRLLAAASLSAMTGCGNTPGGTGPAPGTLTVDVKPAAVAVSGLVLTSCKLQIEGLTVLGDVAPDGRSMIHEFTLDALSSGTSFSLSMLPQGVYSRVRFSVDQMSAAGTWRGTALSLSLEGGDNSVVDLRSDGVEVTPGHDGELALGVDPGSWFAGNVLDGATVASNQILINGTTNGAVGAQILSAVPASFTLQDSTSPLK